MPELKLVPDMSTPEGIKKAFEHVREHIDADADPADIARVLNLEILRILQEVDVEDAEILEEELKRTASATGEPLHEDLRTVGDIYTEDQAAAPAGDDHVNLKRVAGIAYAVSAISGATVAGANGNGDAGAQILQDAQARLEEIGDADAASEANAAQLALGSVINDMFSVLPVSE